MSKTAQRTDPELWERVKSELTRGSKGGRAGEWSARKAQLAVQEYKKRGGEYLGPKSKSNSLRKWTEEEWGTKSGRNSRETGERYLPKKAREALSDEEYHRTSAKKRADTGHGRQFSSQPEKIAQKTARYRSTGSPRKDSLMKRAWEMKISGRSKMTKQELQDAIRMASH